MIDLTDPVTTHDRAIAAQLAPGSETYPYRVVMVTQDGILNMISPQYHKGALETARDFKAALVDAAFSYLADALIVRIEEWDGASWKTHEERVNEPYC